MRDPSRISRILEKLRIYWERNPDLRLGQIIANITRPDDGWSYIEDDKIEMWLGQHLLDDSRPKND